MADRPKSPAYRMGTAKRGNLSSFEGGNPGPGMYEPGLTNRPKSPNWK